MLSFLLCGVVVYDNGTLFDVSVLDITDDDIRARFLQVICIIAIANDHLTLT